MLINDFTFAGKQLADFGCMCCEFDSASGVVEVSSGSDITLNQEKPSGSNYFNLYSTSSEEPFSINMSICYNPCTSDKNDYYLTTDLIRELQKWLMQKNKVLRLNKNGYENVYWVGTFTCKQVMLYERTIGLNITFTANTPYALCDDMIIDCDLSTLHETEFEVSGDIYGYIDADYTITMKEAGDLTISSYYVDQTNGLLILDRQFKLNNCIADEIITIKGNQQLVQSSVTGRNLGKDCNFLLLRLINTYQSYDEKVKNRIIVNRGCTIKIEYSPTAMIGYGYKG